MSDSWVRLWQPYIDTAIGAWQQGDKARTDKIVSLLIQVLIQGQQYKSVDENLVQGLYTVAEHFFAEREYARAEWIYLKVLESQEEALGRDDPHALETLLKLNTLVLAYGASSERRNGSTTPPPC